MRPTQGHLIDDTPLALFGGQGQGLATVQPQTPDPAPVASTGPRKPQEGHPLPDTMRQEIAADVATRTCLNPRCGKPAKAGSHFCSKTCKAKWTANMAAWNGRLDRTPIDDTPDMF